MINFLRQLFGKSTKRPIPQLGLTVTSVFRKLDDRQSIGVLSFNGEYKWGSAGNVDADHIHYQLKLVLVSKDINYLIADFQSMKYSWGNRILESLSLMLASDIKCAVVISNKCQNWPTDYVATFHNLEEAADYLTRPLT